jgi:hypothetical protein
MVHRSGPVIARQPAHPSCDVRGARRLDAGVKIKDAGLDAAVKMDHAYLHTSRLVVGACW